MGITLVRAYITTETGKAKLTKAIAKQLPILLGHERMRRLETGKDVQAPLCKVMGKTLGSPQVWLYLVEHDESGYAWVPAFIVRRDYVEAIEKRGGQVDDPSLVPTVIL